MIPKAVMTGPGTPSFVRRLLAYIFDIVPITMAVAAIFYGFLGFDDSIRDRLTHPDDLAIRVRFLVQRNLIRDISAGLWIPYCALFELSPLRGSPGKYLQGLQVVNWDGNPLSARLAWSRNLSKVISIAALFIGFVWAAFDKYGQAWHDKIAHAYVVRRES